MKRAQCIKIQRNMIDIKGKTQYVIKEIGNNSPQTQNCLIRPESQKGQFYNSGLTWQLSVRNKSLPISPMMH